MSLCTSFYLSRGSIQKKNLPSKWKNAQNPGLVVPSYFPLFPSFSRCFKTRFRAETRTNIWCRDFHEIRASYSYSIPEQRCGFGLVPKRNFWFPGCWENLYLKFTFFSSRDAHLHVCFKKKLHSYSTIPGI